MPWDSIDDIPNRIKERSDTDGWTDDDWDQFLAVVNPLLERGEDEGDAIAQAIGAVNRDQQAAIRHSPVSVSTSEKVGERTVWIDALQQESLRLRDPRTGETYEKEITREYMERVVQNLHDYYARLRNRGVDYRFPIQDSAQRGPHRDSGHRLGDILDARIQGGTFQVKLRFLEGAWSDVEAGKIDNFSVGVDAKYVDPQTGEVYKPMLREVSPTTHPKVKEASLADSTLAASDAPELGLGAPDAPTTHTFAMPTLNSSRIESAIAKTGRTQEQVLEAVASFAGVEVGAVEDHLSGNQQMIDRNIVDAMSRILQIPESELLTESSGDAGGSGEQAQAAGGDDGGSGGEGGEDVAASDEPSNDDVEAQAPAPPSEEEDKSSNASLQAIGERISKLEEMMRKLMDRLQAVSDDKEDEEEMAEPQADDVAAEGSESDASEDGGRIDEIAASIDRLEDELDEARRMASLNTSETGDAGGNAQNGPVFDDAQRAVEYVKDNKGLEGAEASREARENHYSPNA